MRNPFKRKPRMYLDWDAFLSVDYATGKTRNLIEGGLY